MIESIVQKLLYVNISAGCMAMVVLLLRQIFHRRIPYKAFLLLWAVVALRLMCPVTISTPIGLLPEIQSSSTDSVQPNEASGSLAFDATETDTSTVSPAIQYSSSASNPASINSYEVFFVIWLAGASVTTVIFGIFVLAVVAKIRTAKTYSSKIRISENITAPFVFGVFLPKIYLPESLSGEDFRIILEHERQHLRHHDSLWKAIAAALLCAFWFNPIIWVSYFAFCRDIEHACDEAVTHDKDLAEKKEYAKALIKFGVEGTQEVLGVSFGEKPIEKRVKNILKSKKAKSVIPFAVIAILLVATAAFAAGLHSVAPTEEAESIASETQTTDEAQSDQEAIPLSQEEKIKLAVSQFAERLYSSMLGSSDIHFDRSEFASADGYAVATFFENMRNGYLEEHTNGIYDYSISTRIDNIEENGETVMVSAAINCVFFFGESERTYWGENYIITLKTASDDYTVIEFKAPYNKEIAMLKN